MKFTVIIGAALLTVVANTVSAQVIYLDHQHMDFRMEYDPSATDTNRLDIVLGYDIGTDHLRATNQQIFIVGNTNAKLTIPNNPDYAFLGTAGAPIWILPQSQNLSLPYLGTSGEDLPLGVFDGPVVFELRSVEGPGDFFVWQTSGAGQPPIIKMICTNGVVSSQYNSTAPLIGSHEHFNWGFGTNGLYRVTFRCTGKLLNESTNIVGRDVAWAFQILPLRPFEEWVSTNWLPATATNIAGSSADPDGDGTINVLEYAFGTDPNFALRTNLPVFAFTNIAGINYGALRYSRATNATDLSFTVVAADNLLGGSWTSLTNVADVATNGPRETVTVRDNVSVSDSACRFYQLRVKLNYP